MHQTWLKWVSSFQGYHKIDRQMWNPRHVLNWNREATFENCLVTPSPPITMANIYQVFTRCCVKKCIRTCSNVILKGALGGRCFYQHFRDDKFRKRLGSWPRGIIAPLWQSWDLNPGYKLLTINLTTCWLQGTNEVWNQKQWINTITPLLIWVCCIHIVGFPYIKHDVLLKKDYKLCQQKPPQGNEDHLL